MPIGEWSKSKGALATFDYLRLLLEESGLTYTLKRVGSGGWNWADPSVVVQGPNHPSILYANVTADRVPDLIASLKAGKPHEELAVGTFADTPVGISSQSRSTRSSPGRKNSSPPTGALSTLNRLRTTSRVAGTVR